MSRSPCSLAAHWERFAVEWLERGTCSRTRLIRRGLAPMALSGPPGWDTRLAMRCSPVPDQLVHSTMTCASEVAKSGVLTKAATAAVVCLVQRTVWSMTMSKIGSLVAGIALLGFVGYGVGVAVATAQAVQAKGKRSTTNTPRQNGSFDRGFDDGERTSQVRNVDLDDRAERVEGQERRSRLRARFGGSSRFVDEPADHDQSSRSDLQERDTRHAKRPNTT